MPDIQGPTKADARLFLRRLQELGPDAGGTGDIRSVIREMQERHGMAEKRCLFLLDKWAGRGWYDYGTCVDGGWLTPEGLGVDVSKGGTNA